MVLVPSLAKSLLAAPPEGPSFSVPPQSPLLASGPALVSLELRVDELLRSDLIIVAEAVRRPEVSISEL